MESGLVPKSELRGTSRAALAVAAWPGLVLALTLGLCMCSRKAEIEDAPDGGGVTPMQIPYPADGVPVVEDSGIGAGGAACGDRPSQNACMGVNDFPCAFDDWIRTLTDACQNQTDCHTDGWVEVVTDAEGCASELRMEDPDPEYVECLTRELNRYRCGQCADVLSNRFLGASNDGCPEVTCGTGELRCPPGFVCQAGVCVESGAGSGGAAN
jgi:hypothetical protein